MRSIGIHQFLETHGIAVGNTACKRNVRSLGDGAETLRAELVNNKMIWSKEVGGKRKYIFDAPINHLAPDAKVEISSRIKRRRLELHPDKFKDQKEREKATKEMSIFNNHITTFTRPPNDSSIILVAITNSRDLFNVDKWNDTKNIKMGLIQASKNIMKLDQMHKDLTSKFINDKALGKVDIKNNDVIFSIYVTCIVYMTEILAHHDWGEETHELKISVLNIFNEMTFDDSYTQDIYQTIHKLEKRVNKLENAINKSKTLIKGIEKIANTIHIVKWFRIVSELLTKTDIRLNTASNVFQGMFNDAITNATIHNSIYTDNRKQINNQLMVDNEGNYGIISRKTIYWLEIRDDDKVFVKKQGRKPNNLQPVVYKGHLIRGTTKRRHPYSFVLENTDQKVSWSHFIHQ
jgi:hypothetical protein